jgi:hypothetical protein
MQATAREGVRGFVGAGEKEARMSYAQVIFHNVSFT